jgi:hypothetical protein
MVTLAELSLLSESLADSTSVSVPLKPLVGVLNSETAFQTTFTASGSPYEAQGAPGD